MIITNLKIYDFEESMLASGYAMMVNIPQGEEREDEISNVTLDVIMRNEGNNKHLKRGMRLVKAPLNSGHPNFLSGILVSMDVTFSNKVWTEWQRYHFQQIVTSQSCMHKISKFDLDEAFVEYTDKVIIEILKELQEQYNTSVMQLQRHTQLKEYLNHAGKQMERHNALGLDTLLTNHRLSSMSTFTDSQFKFLVLLAIQLISHKTLYNILIQCIKSSRFGHQRIPIFGILIVSPRLIPQHSRAHTHIASPSDSRRRVFCNLRYGINHIFGSRCAPLFV